MTQDVTLCQSIMLETSFDTGCISEMVRGNTDVQRFHNLLDLIRQFSLLEHEDPQLVRIVIGCLTDAVWELSEGNVSVCHVDSLRSSMRELVWSGVDKRFRKLFDEINDVP